ncbi:MAG TPA: DUF2007 domain-containing protein [Ferruginibacter sp.]|nr:DUF2007 domain-containing protein [Ferruginibacter sp.]
MNFVKIASYDNYLSANMTLGMLEENNINCHLKDENIVTIDPLLNPALGGIKLMVAETQVDRAIELIKQAEADYLKTTPCPNCGTYALIVKEITNIPDSFWGKLKNKLAYGQESTYKKMYHCEQCGKDFDELNSM